MKGNFEDQDRPAIENLGSHLTQTISAHAPSLLSFRPSTRNYNTARRIPLKRIKMFRQTALRLARATPAYQPRANQVSTTVFTQSTKAVGKSPSRAFSTSPRTAIKRGLWIAEGKRKDSTATLFKKAEDFRFQQEQRSQERSQEEARKVEEEAHKREEEVRRQHEAVSANIGRDDCWYQRCPQSSSSTQEADVLDGIWHRSIYSDLGS
jgi:hypothetical protein